MQMTDNAGATDEHRALNYLAMRYPGLYVAVAEQFSRNASLTGRGAPFDAEHHTAHRRGRTGLHQP
jgi:hypothetical protein